MTTFEWQKKRKRLCIKNTGNHDIGKFYQQSEHTLRVCWIHIIQRRQIIRNVDSQRGLTRSSIRGEANQLDRFESSSGNPSQGIKGTLSRLPQSTVLLKYRNTIPKSAQILLFVINFAIDSNRNCFHRLYRVQACLDFSTTNISRCMSLEKNCKRNFLY